MKKFLIYGFSENEIIKMKNLVKFVSQNIKYITILDEDFEKKLLDVIENEKFVFQDKFLLDEKVVIFQNVVPKELDIYYKILKTKLNKKIIFANVTENSINMKIEDLFNEFKMERDFFKKNK